MITLKKQHQGYEKYKNASVQWLEQIPNSWEFRRAKFIFRQMRRQANENDEIITAFRDGVVTARKNRREEGFTNAIQEIGYQGIRSGDLVIHGMDGFAGAIGVSDSDGKASPVYSVCSAILDVSNNYYSYLLRYLAKNNYLLSLAKGIRERSTDFRFKEFAELFLPIFSRHEQSLIASYLDEKCALIDRIIEDKKKQIEILQEQRAAIINQAVTKWLGEKVEMKESGVEWIGQMPKPWDIKKLKTVFRFEKGKRAGLFTKEYVSDQKNIGEYPVYSGQTEDEGVMGRINSYIYDLDDTIFTTTVGAKVMTPMIIGGKFSLSQNCVLFIKQDKKIDVRYFYYQLFPMFKWEKDSIPSHMQPSLRVSDLNKYSIAFPAYEEQVKIANYIEEKTKFIDEFSKEIERSISLLNEYKNSLISHMVTGKIKAPTHDHV